MLIQGIHTSFSATLGRCCLSFLLLLCGVMLAGLVADAAAFFLGERIGKLTRSSSPKMREFFFRFLAGIPRLLSSTPGSVFTGDMSSSLPILKTQNKYIIFSLQSKLYS
jgi:hypothetical protein